MKARRVVLIFSILLGIATAAGIYIYVRNQQVAPVDPIVYRKVVVAVTTIPENTIITSDMIQLRDVPEQAVHVDAFTDTEGLIGAVTSASIVKDEQVLKSRVVQGLGEGGDKLSYIIPENMRAISIPISELSAVSGYIKNGDFIDILVTYIESDLYPLEVTPTPSPAPTPPVEGEPAATEPVPTEVERLWTTVYTQFQKIEVLRITPANQAADDTSLPATMVLLVTPEQAEELVFAMDSGSLTLTLRNPADGVIQELEFYNAEKFREQYIDPLFETGETSEVA